MIPADGSQPADDAAPEGWEPVRRLRAHEQVMTQIEERINAGQLKAGDRLPSERDLAALLGVSRPSLRESIRVLEALGILEVRRGGGAEGGAVLVAEPGDGLVNLLRLQLALGHFTHDDVLRTRVTLETWSCAEAARSAAEADHRELAEILDRMDDPAVNMQEFNRLDALFHVRIARAAGNALTAHLMSSLRGAINRQMVEVYQRLPDWRSTATMVRREHREILAALERRDGQAAADLVQRHIERFYAAHPIAPRQAAPTARRDPQEQE